MATTTTHRAAAFQRTHERLMDDIQAGRAERAQIEARWLAHLARLVPPYAVRKQLREATLKVGR